MRPGKIQENISARKMTQKIIKIVEYFQNLVGEQDQKIIDATKVMKTDIQMT